ncbi:type VI secretion system baseplate subunit TssF [Xenorhabdus doucetiae]|uniref:Type VI secretion system (T6SS) ImpG/VasA family protein n=1 Tax=Xenorhabdus doucetiae TaxID=351671 RepID=A0A068QZD9_9GAMM|nr:type VI secretion system baseplate subunit TssF [Xenorhabdus doucetiae]TYP04439.1 type VI secretion system (T6SS) ImpG/VasA family protein [Xenorhabdus doucetiae]CDG19185.1 protein of unknown function [Xenorhabdus doucetiae]
MKNNKESLYLKVLAYLRALVSNLRDKLEDDFPEITHGILSRIWPLALSPIPPTTIMQFYPTDGEQQGTVDIPAGTPVKGEVIYGSTANLISPINTPQKIEFNFYLVPSLLPNDSAIENFFPNHRQPNKSNSNNILHHFSGVYIDFIKEKLVSLCIPDNNIIYKEKMQNFKDKMNKQRDELKEEYLNYQYFLKLEQQIGSRLSFSQESESGKRAFDYFIHNEKSNKS